MKGYLTKDTNSAQRASSVKGMGNNTNSQVHYFDALNNQPLNRAAKLGLEQALAHAWADPSRLYSNSRKSRQLLEEGRNSLAQKLLLKPTEIIFAPGFPFVFSYLVNRLMQSEKRKNKKILLSEVEQSALLSSAGNFLHQKIAVKENAQVDAKQFVENLSSEVGLAVIQFANHEIGTKQPIAEIYQACKSRGIDLLVDATMTFALDEIGDNFDILVLNPVSWQGPAGLSVVAIRENVELISPLKRDTRENQKFPAFPNVPLAISAAAALEETIQKLPKTLSQMQKAQNVITEKISLIPGARVITDPTVSLCNIICAIFEDIDGETLVHELDKSGFEISSGSSCRADEIAPSHVMQAIGLANATNIRISLPVDLDEISAIDFATSLTNAIGKIRSKSSNVTY
ncbi:MAG: aminotransferase class V-fold PLP-dependent enzyme [Candidatus Nanopelagicales bacterium]